MAIGCSISGLVVGAVRGWAISLCILATAPFIALSATFYGKALSGGMNAGLLAYSQSAGYAEQAISAIRVVIAFGMEVQEIRNYTRYLDRAKKASVKTHILTALAIATLWMIVYFSYAYAFYIGSLFVQYNVYNSALKKNYSAGDTIGCFFAVIIGLFNIAMTSGQMKSIIEGRVAAKFAFEVIDR